MIFFLAWGQTANILGNANTATLDLAWALADQELMIQYLHNILNGLLQK